MLTDGLPDVIPIPFGDKPVSPPFKLFDQFIFNACLISRTEIKPSGVGVVCVENARPEAPECGRVRLACKARCPSGQFADQDTETPM